MRYQTINIFKINMSERKSWSNQEDQALKHLYEVRQIHRWSSIAKLMLQEYGLQGRNGKQCRERYHNHLNPHITKDSWKAHEQKLLIKLHNEFGNRWAMIARKLPGRTDNCVKNHFYSKVRKAIRNINKIITQHFRKEFKEIKVDLLYKIIEIAQEKYRNEFKNSTEVQNICYEVKNQLLEYSFDEEPQEHIHPLELTTITLMLKKINEFNRFAKLKPKKKREKKMNLYDDEEQIFDEMMLSESNLTQKKATRQSRTKQLSESNLTNQSQININSQNASSSLQLSIQSSKQLHHQPQTTIQISSLPNLFQQQQLLVGQIESLFLESFDFMEKHQDSIFGFSFNEHNIFTSLK